MINFGKDYGNFNLPKSDSTISKQDLYSDILEEEPIKKITFDVTKVPGYDKLDEFQQYGARNAEKILMLSEKDGSIDSSKIKSVCDFGAGSGGPTFAIKNYFKLQDKDMTALEKEDWWEKIIKHNILPESSVITGDGIEYLNSGQKKYDLITACMFQPNEGELFINLFNSAKNSINPGGKLLIYSDNPTINVVERLCKNHNLEYSYRPVLPDDQPIPARIIISLDKSADTPFKSQFTVPETSIYEEPFYDFRLKRDSSPEEEKRVKFNEYIRKMLDKYKEIPFSK